MDYIILILCALIIVLLVMLLMKKPAKDNSSELLSQKMDINAKQGSDQMDRILEQMRVLTEKNYEQQIKLMETLNENAEKQTKVISESVASMQKNNEEKLEQMRKTVDEKLSETLNKRLNESFKTVSEQLSNVYRSLGEMKELSSGVTDNIRGLNRVLTNVKSRGTWAEVQLSNILDQTIPGMYETNVSTNPKYNGRVEFAVKVPNNEDDSFTYLPIDSEGIGRAKKALEARIRDEAKLIKNYISSPETTPFAIMYLATEGLYAEITGSKTGISERLQAEGIMIAGPSTITALLNSLAMGFRTMAINKKANEVWKTLGTAKKQYSMFGELLAKARKKVEEAGKVLDDANHRNDVIQKHLRNVETLEDSGNDLPGFEEE